MRAAERAAGGPGADRGRGSRAGSVTTERAVGSVTAELAVLMPGVLLLLTCLTGVWTVVGAQLRCADAARSAARVLARGQGAADALAAARRDAPAASQVSFAASGAVVRVQVLTRVRPLPGAPAIALRAAAVAVPERPAGGW